MAIGYEESKGMKEIVSGMGSRRFWDEKAIESSRRTVAASSCDV